MYKQVATEPLITFESNMIVSPVASLEDEHGGEAHIYIDDHCYVCALKQGEYVKNTHHIFPELWTVLSDLPALTMP